MHITRNDVENNILKVMEEEDLYGLVAGTNPLDCAWVKQLSKLEKRVIPTFGLHPWYADQYELKEMNAYLHDCVIIGEIGMDNVWCNIDLSCQRKIFIQQMDIAEERGCPIILHTKGQEHEIGTIIANYSMPIIVHWYSSSKHLDLYLKRDCYFNVGPDARQNSTVQLVIKNASLNRLLVESDGISAIEWALKKEIKPKDLPGVLLNSISYISEVKGIEVDTVLKAMEKNFEHLFRTNV